MNIQVENFYELVKQEWTYLKIGKKMYLKGGFS